MINQTIFNMSKGGMMITYEEKSICRLDMNSDSFRFHGLGATVAAALKYLVSPQPSDSVEEIGAVSKTGILGVAKTFLWLMISVGAGFLIATL